MKYLKPTIDIWKGLKYTSDSWQNFNLGFLTLLRANPQIHSSKLLAKADELFECV